MTVAHEATVKVMGLTKRAAIAVAGNSTKVDLNITSQFGNITGSITRVTALQLAQDLIAAASFAG